MTDGNADLDALVQQTMAIAKSIRVEPNISERDLGCARDVDLNARTIPNGERKPQ